MKRILLYALVSLLFCEFNTQAGILDLFTIEKNFSCFSRATDFDFERDSKDVLEIISQNHQTLGTDQLNEDQLNALLKEKTLRIPGYPVCPVQIKVIHDNNKVAGFIVYFSRKLTVGQVLLLAVSSEHRKKGYGYELLSAAIADLKAQNIQLICLDVFSNNKPAINLYYRVGFQSAFSDSDHHRLVLTIAKDFSQTENQ